ncbi:MAG: hypothetical protein N2645_13560 [Clostridia bacterium]|nr:hypothetical protein [Clostridia bacterium]
MCNDCIYKDSSKIRSEILKKAAHRFGYYKMALKAAIEKNNREDMEKYGLIVEVLNEIIASGRY